MKVKNSFFSIFILGLFFVFTENFAMQQILDENLGPKEELLRCLSPLSAACFTGRFRIEAKKNDNLDAMCCAIMGGQIRMVNFLIVNGWSLENPKYLVVALVSDHFDIAKILVDNGAEINIEKLRALGFFDKVKYLEILKYIVEKAEKSDN